MLISHKHKFIFIKPTKVAGTSLESALINNCGEKDIITRIIDYDKSSDENYFSHKPQNNDRYLEHELALIIKAKLGEKIWNSYYKFTIVRNPWDFMVSLYYWQRSNIRKSFLQATDASLSSLQIISNLFKWLVRTIMLSNFFTFICFFVFRYYLEWFLNRFLKYKTHLIDPKYLNKNFYFNKKAELICDFYLKYETLEDDYKLVCNHLNIKYFELPRLKTKIRKTKKHYSQNYNIFTKFLIENVFSKEIKAFDYSFEHG